MLIPKFRLLLTKNELVLTQVIGAKGLEFYDCLERLSNQIVAY